MCQDIVHAGGDQAQVGIVHNYMTYEPKVRCRPTCSAGSVVQLSRGLTILAASGLRVLYSSAQQNICRNDSGL